MISPAIIMGKMKIAYIANSRIPSRTANSVQVMKMCQAFARLGHDVHLIVPDIIDDISASDVYAFYGVDRCFEIIRVPWLSVRGRTLFYAIMATLKARKLKPDLVYGRFLPGIYVCDWMNLSVAYEAHKPASDESWLNNWCLSRLLKKTSFKRLVVISDALRLNLLKNSAIKEGVIKVAHDAADEPAHGSELNLVGHGKLKAGYIGHLYPGKGVELIEEIARQCPWVDFHLVGGMPNDVDFWKKKLSGLNNVYLHGFVPHAESAAYRENVDVLLAPYQEKVEAEGGQDISQWMSPLKIFEYMAAGKPILCSDLPVLREVMKNGENSILCASDDAASWTAALTKLHNDPRLGAQLGENARKEFQEKYTWDARARSVLEGIGA